MGQLNYFLLAQQCFKVVGPALAHYWHANPTFANGFHNLPTMAQLSVLLGLDNPDYIELLKHLRIIHKGFL